MFPERARGRSGSIVRDELEQTSIRIAHGVIYRLILGAVVLAIVIPAAMSGHQPMWPFALIAIAVVILGIVVARQSRLRA